METYAIVIAVLFLALLLPIIQADLMKVGEANGQFAIDLYHNLRKNTRENIFFSPLSISTALAMTYLGAAGNTKTQMSETLHFSPLGNNVHQAFKDLNKLLYDPNNNYTLRSANRLFSRTGYTFLQSYLQDCANYYTAGVKELDFNGKTEESRTYINDWVANKTEDKIKDLLPQGSVTKGTAMVLVNAIYFKGLWDSPFKESDTQANTFHLNSKKNVIIPMMFQENYFRKFHSMDLNANILEMDYNGGKVSMFFIVPEDVDRGLADLEENLTAARLTSALKSTSQSSKREIHVYVPRFKMEDEFSLSDTLKSLKMTDLFTAKADLSGMDGKRDLQVTEVVHKSFVEVNEKGTEAAAATGVIVSMTAIQKPIYFRADRPFLFVLQEKQSGSVLFMGRMRAPPGVPVPEALSRSSPSVLASFLMLILSLLATLNI